MASQFGVSDIFPLPLDSYDQFEAAFRSSSSKGPASLPHPNPSKAFWTHPGLTKDWPKADWDPEGNRRVNPLAKEGSHGGLESEADLVIIGSGITGVSVAMEMSRLSRQAGEKMKVVILEARDFCSGATGRNGGHLTASISQHFSTLAKFYPLEEVKRCYQLEDHTVSALMQLIHENGWEAEVDLVNGGHVTLLLTAIEQSAAKADWEEAKKAGIERMDQLEWLAAEDTQKEYGSAYPAFRMPGNNVWPLKLTTKMFYEARGDQRHKKSDHSSNSRTCGEGVIEFVKNFIPSGSESSPSLDEKGNPSSNTSDPFQLILHTHTPVTSVEPVHQHPEKAEPTPYKFLVHTPRGVIQTHRVVYATNAYTSHLLPYLAGPDGIVPVRGQVVAVRADVGYADEGDEKGLSRSGWTGNEGFEYWFPRPHPESPQGAPNHHPLIILGGGRETIPGYAMYETDDSVLDREASAGLRKFLPTVFPGKFSPSANETESKVELEWSGIMGFTRSGDPFVGRVIGADGVVSPGQYIAAGYTGHGMPRAYGCAEAMVGLIWADLKGTTWSPPSWLPRHYLTERHWD